MAENKLDFFSDMRDRLFPIIIGLVSVYTLVPVFINQIREIFNWGIALSYSVFVFLYFLLPLVFYLLYCSIYDYVGFLQLLPADLYNQIKSKRGRQVVIECTIIIIVLIFLLCPCSLFSWSFSLMLYAGSIFCYLNYAWTYFKIESLRGDVKEFLIIGIGIILLFTFFFANNFSSVQKSFCSYNWEGRKSSFNNFEYKNSLKNVTDSTQRWKDYFYQKTLQDFSQNPDTPITTVHIDSSYIEKFVCLYEVFNCTDNGGERNWDANFSKKISSSFSALDNRLNAELKPKISLKYKVFEMSDYMNSYAHKIADKKMKTILKSWTALIVNLQFKGLLWLQALIILGLCLWLKMRRQLADITQGPYIIHKNPDNEFIQKTNDNLEQIKSFIYISALLVLPFFKKIDEKNINLDRPFISSGIKDLSDIPNPDKKENIDIDGLTAELKKIEATLNQLSENEPSRHDRTYKGVNGQWEK